MESDVKDLLKNIVERLSKIETQQEDQLKKQSQTDQIIERLDTIQSLLLEKLSDVSTQLEQEKVFMRDQLKEAQDEILHRLTELQQQNVSTRSQAVSVGEEMGQLKSTAGPNPVKETAEFCSQADGDVMDARLAKMSETLEQSVKAITRTEIVWLDSQIEQRISAFETAVFQQFLELSSQGSELPEPNMKLVEAMKKQNEDMVMDVKIDLSEEIREMAETLIKETQTLKRNIEETSAISVSKQREDMRSLYTELVTHVNKTSVELSENVGTAKDEITDYMKTVVTSHKETAVNTQEEVKAAVMGSTEQVSDLLHKVKEQLIADVNKVTQELRNEMSVLQKSTVRESLDKVSTDMEKVKRDLVSFVEAQCQVTRDVISGIFRNTTPRKYVFDFYIENFRQLVRSGKTVISLPWHINQVGSSIRGYVRFLTSDVMKIWLMHGRHPLQVGLHPRSSVWLKVKLTIKDTSGRLLDWMVAEKTWVHDEASIKNNKNTGETLGEVSCDDLLLYGFGMTEGYMNDALLLRYEIEVLN